MKYLRLWTLGLFSVVALGLVAPDASATDEDCPTDTLKGTIARIDVKRRHIALVTEDQQEMGVLVTEKTKYRISGYKKKELRTDALAKVPLDSQATIKYCMNTGEAVEVKVKKQKGKKE